MNYESQDYGLFIIWMPGLTLYDEATENTQTILEMLQFINQSQVFTFTKPAFEVALHFNKVHYTNLEAKVNLLGEVTFTAKKVGKSTEGLSVYALNRLERTLAKDLLARVRSQERYLRTTLRNIYLTDAKKKISGLLEVIGDRQESRIVDYMEKVTNV